MSTTFDALIIGTGQAGPSLAARLSGSGMKVAVIERDRFGGTCVNNGCTPTKAMVASAYAAHLARRAAEYGVTSVGTPRVDMRRVKARKDEIVGGLPQRPRKLAERAREREGVPRPRAIRRTQLGRGQRHRADRRQDLRERRRPSAHPALSRHRQHTLSHQRIDDGPRGAARASHRRGRQLRRARVRADLSTLRQSRHRRGNGPAPASGGRTRTCRSPFRIFCAPKASLCDSTRPASACTRAAAGGRCGRELRRRRSARDRLACAARGRACAEHRKISGSAAPAFTRTSTVTSKSMNPCALRIRTCGRSATATARARSRTLRTTTTRSSPTTCF